MRCFDAAEMERRSHESVHSERHWPVHVQRDVHGEHVCGVLRVLSHGVEIVFFDAKDGPPDGLYRGHSRELDRKREEGTNESRHRTAVGTWLPGIIATIPWKEHLGIDAAQDIYQPVDMAGVRRNADIIRWRKKLGHRAIYTDYKTILKLIIPWKLVNIIWLSYICSLN